MFGVSESMHLKIISMIFEFDKRLTNDTMNYKTLWSFKKKSIIFYLEFDTKYMLSYKNRERGEYNVLQVHTCAYSYILLDILILYCCSPGAYIPRNYGYWPPYMKRSPFYAIKNYRYFRSTNKQWRFSLW